MLVSRCPFVVNVLDNGDIMQGSSFCGDHLMMGIPDLECLFGRTPLSVLSQLQVM